MVIADVTMNITVTRLVILIASSSVIVNVLRVYPSLDDVFSTIVPYGYLGCNAFHEEHLLPLRVLVRASF